MLSYETGFPEPERDSLDQWAKNDAKRIIYALHAATLNLERQEYRRELADMYLEKNGIFGFDEAVPTKDMLIARRIMGVSLANPQGVTKQYLRTALFGERLFVPWSDNLRLLVQHEMIDHRQTGRKENFRPNSDFIAAMQTTPEAWAPLFGAAREFDATFSIARLAVPDDLLEDVPLPADAD